MKPEPIAPTDQQLEAYLRNLGDAACPSCGSADLAFEGIEGDSGRLYQRIECHKCGLGWSDGFTLDSVLVDGRDEFYQTTLVSWKSVESEAASAQTKGE